MRLASDFSFPVSLSKVDTKPEYSKEELINGGLLEECVECLSTERAYNVESCYSVYIQVLKQFPAVPESLRVDYWKALIGALQGLCQELRSQELTGLTSEEKQQHRNTLKMLCYLLVQWIETQENNCSPSSKAGSTPAIWRTARHTTLSVLVTMMTLPVTGLWDPPSPAMLNDLAGVVGGACYKILENPSITRDKALFDQIVGLLGVLVRDYSQGFSLSLKVPQLLSHFDHLVSPLSQAVVTLTNNFGARSIVPDIIREIASKDPAALSADPSGTRCHAGFMLEVVEALPSHALPVVSVLMPHLAGESYTFRNAILGVIGHLLMHLTKVQGSTIRDQLLSKLLEYVYDINAFVRVKVLQILNGLMASQGLPLHCVLEVVELAAGRLLDKSSSVRKTAFQLLTTAVQSNPFGPQLTLEHFRPLLTLERAKLSQLEQDTSEHARQSTLVDYLSNTVSFVEAITTHLPLVIQMLRSKVSSDALEAIQLLSKCVKFGIAAAQSGIQRSLALVWSNDPAIRKAVLEVHIQLYLDPGEEGGGRARTVANNLLILVRSSSYSQLASLERLLGMLVEREFITAPVIKCLWDSFKQRAADSALAVKVLAMIGSVQPTVISSNFSLLVDTGIAEQGESKDLILAEQICLALSKMAASSLPNGKLLSNAHLLSQLRDLLLDHVADLSTSNWPSLTESVLVCVFRLALCPVQWSQELLHCLITKALPEQNTTLDCEVMSRVLSAAGGVAHQLMLHTETTVTKELKRRSLKEDKGTASDKDGEELALAGASGDDPVIELIKRVLDGEVGGTSGLLATFEPLIMEILANPTKYPNVGLSNSAVLALGKFMLISPSMCERHLRLFFTVLKKSSLESVRANAVVLASDLACRFPNLIEPWTPHLYARLGDTSTIVRRSTLMVLTHLILNDMIKVRGQIGAIALAIEDQDSKIADLAKYLFNELASKGNTLYNVIPDIVSSLSGGDEKIEQSTFHNIVRHIFGLIQKEKQCESLVEKLCHRFRAVRVEQQARDLAHCLSQLSASERSLRKLHDNFPCFKDWLFDGSVFSAFNALLTKAKKFNKPEVKGQIDDLERLFKEAHDKGIDTPSPVPNCESETPDDFTDDVLSSARRSLVRATPQSTLRGQHKGHSLLTRASEGAGSPKLQLDYED